MTITIDLENVTKDELRMEFDRVENIEKTINTAHIYRKDVKEVEKVLEHIECYKSIKKFVAKIDKPNPLVDEAIEGISNDVERVFIEEAKKTEYENIYYHIKNQKETEANDIKNTTQIIAAKQTDPKIELETKELEIKSLCNNLSEALKAKIKILEQLKRDENSFAKTLAKFDAFILYSKTLSRVIPPNLSSRSIVQLVESKTKIKNEIRSEEQVTITEENVNPDSTTKNSAFSNAREVAGDKCYVCKRPFMRSHQHYPKVRTHYFYIIQFVQFYAPRESLAIKFLNSNLFNFHLTSLFYQMCNECGEFNWQKRSPKINLTGKIALVTGARVKIGYYTALMLLRCGATVIATTRFSRDAAARFCKV